MRSVFWAVAAAAPLLAGTLTASAQSRVKSAFDALAGVSSAPLTQNFQDPTRHPYQHRIFLGPDICKEGARCVMFFPAIDSSRMLIRHMSCWASVANGSIVQAIYVSNMVGQNRDPAMRRNYVPFTVSGTDGTNAYLVVNAETYLLVEKGKQPTVTFFVSAPAAVDCTISGYY